MIVLYAILLILILSSVKFLTNGECWNKDYISKDTANVVKGICIWLVFICHISQYIVRIPNLNLADELCFNLNGYLKQLIVVPFLFYSGYGVTLSIFRKGADYADKIPQKRVLSTLINFDIAVLFFLIMNIVLGLELSLRQVLYSFVGWDSIRNSNWYIFCIIICYLISWASYKLARGNRSMLIAIWMGILFYTAIMYFFKGHWWYDTIYAYGAGAIFAVYNKQIVEYIKNHYNSTLFIGMLGFLIFYNAPNYFSISANISAVFLCGLLVLLTLKVKLKNFALEWSGKLLFPIYIYQRLSMVALATIYGGEFMIQNRYLYIIFCLGITLVIAAIYNYNGNLSFSKIVSCQRKA